MKNQPTLLFLIAVLSLVGIGLVVGNNFFQNKFKNNINQSQKVDVLGETKQDIDRLVSDTFQNVSEVAIEKAQEVQKGVVANLEKEAANLTKSQVDSLKLQICRDWGVLR